MWCVVCKANYAHKISKEGQAFCPFCSKRNEEYKPEKQINM